MARDTSELVSKYRASGLPQKSFSDKYKIPLSTLQYHLHKQKGSSGQTTPRFISLSATSDRPLVMASIAIIRGSFTPEQICAIIRADSTR
jgi:hypothetical protein